VCRIVALHHAFLVLTTLDSTLQRVGWVFDSSTICSILTRGVGVIFCCCAGKAGVCSISRNKTRSPVRSSWDWRNSVKDYNLAKFAVLFREVNALSSSTYLRFQREW
jgi:hypothetical protein